MTHPSTREHGSVTRSAHDAAGEPGHGSSSRPAHEAGSGAPAARDLGAGFIVIHGNQSETLRDLLCDWMRAHPLAPLENEVILVQSNGIAQWLTLSLASDPLAPDAAASEAAASEQAVFSAGEGGGFGNGLGIAAALDIQLPSRFIWQAYRAVLGNDAVPERAPLGKDLSTWRLMRMLPELLHHETFAPLRRFLEDDAMLRRRHQLAAQLADLFDQYQVYRADWLADWAAGRDVLRTARAVAPAGSGVGTPSVGTAGHSSHARADASMDAEAGAQADVQTSFMSGQNLHAQMMLQGMPSGVRPVPAESLWQPALWRALLVDGGTHGEVDNRAAVHQRFMAACMDPDRARPPGLPRRVLVFGISAMPRQSLEVLSALGRWCQVLMCVQNPCRHYWGDIVPERELLSPRRGRHAPRGMAGMLRPAGASGQSGVPDQSDAFDAFPVTGEAGESDLHDHSGASASASAPAGALLAGVEHGQALLAAWGRQGRDFIGLLAEHDEPEAAERRLLSINRRADVFIDHEPADTLLAQLQQDILDLAPLAETRTRWPAVNPARDRSIRFQVCHSAQREVEVLHDQLLAAFAADPTLQPRDVIVMVPEITGYAPHIMAVFGLYGRRDPRFIPFSISDQQSRMHEPLLAALEMLLGLPQGRVTVSEVLDLLDVPAVQRRFGIEPQALPRLREWIEQSGIRWGLDDVQRQSLELSHIGEQNSWRFGLRRMLLGYATGQASGWQEIEPLDEISGLDGELLGRLLAVLDALQRTWEAFRIEACPAEWGVRLQAMLDDFFLASEGQDGLLLMRLNESLQQWLDDCVEARMDLPLPLSVVREHWLANIDDDGLGRRFFAGAVTFATLMPMRAIPFRHVCLLGMNDGDFPRSRQPADFDLMAGDYRPGDRSRREDDRYLFLEALLSARERLSISWVGRSIHDDAPRPPSVLVAQLRDHIAAGWRLAAPVDGQRIVEETGEALLEAITTQHRLQPFSRSYFVREAGVGDPLFSYATEWREALKKAQSLRGEASGASVSWPALPLNEWPEALTLADLTAFLKAPVKYFFQKRLGIYWNREEEVLPGHEPFELNGLETWQVRDELVQAQLHWLKQQEGGMSEPAWQYLLADDAQQEVLLQSLAGIREGVLVRAARAGRLPVGAFGELQRETIETPMPHMVGSYLKALRDTPQVLQDEPFVWEPSVSGSGGALPGAGYSGAMRPEKGRAGALGAWDGDVWKEEAGDSMRLPAVEGTLDHLRATPDGTRVRLVMMASLLLEKGRSSTSRQYRYDKLLDHWVYHLAGNLSGGPMATWLIGASESSSIVRLQPLEADEARMRWQELMQAWREGMLRPLPLAPKTGFAWLFKPGDPGAGSSESGNSEPDGSEPGNAESDGGGLGGGELGGSGSAGREPGNGEPVGSGAGMSTSGTGAPDVTGAGGRGEDRQKSWDAVTKVYEGDSDAGYEDMSRGERSRDPYLARAWPDMMSLWQGGEFGVWVNRLLRPVRDAVAKEAKGKAEKGAKADTEDAASTAETPPGAGAGAGAGAGEAAGKTRKQGVSKAGKPASRGRKGDEA